jgi:hypothetical protein
MENMRKKALARAAESATTDEDQFASEVEAEAVSSHEAMLMGARER